MGTAIVAKNTSAIDSGLRKIVPPVTRGLEAIHFLSGSAERAAANYAAGKPNATSVGAPAITANFATLKALTNYIQTEVADAPTQTIFRVVRTSDTMVDVDHCPVFDSTYSSGSNLGTMFYGNVGGNINQTAACFADASLTTISTRAVSLSNGTEIFPATFSLIVTSVGATQTVVRNETLGITDQSVVNTFGRRPSTRPFRLGSAYVEGNTHYKGTCDVAFWQHHSVLLTPSEIALTVARIREIMLKLHGITV